MRRTARHTFATVTIAALLFACSGDPEPEPLDLTADDAGAEESDDGNADGAEGVDGELSAELPEPAYPELPPFEPDPDSNLTEDEQRELYAFYVDLHDAVNTSLSTASVDDRLRDHFSPEVMEEFAGVIRGMDDDGVVSLAPTLQVLELQYDRLEDDLVAIHECQRTGAREGYYDVQTGERISSADEQVLLVSSFIRTASAFEVVDSTAAEGRERCGAAG